MNKLIYKSRIIMVAMSLSWISMGAQEDQLDVQFDSRIRGNLQIHHINDSSSIFIGWDAGKNYSYGTIPAHNTFFGMSSGQEAQGINNTFLGAWAGVSTQGDANSVIGATAGGLISSDKNSFLGDEAGGYHQTGDYNVFLGNISGWMHEDGSANTYFGANTGNTTLYPNRGDHNTFIGARSGSISEISPDSRIGSRNTFIGANSGSLNLADSLVRAIAIGYDAKVGCSNCGVIGGTGADAVRVGINQPDPLTSLHVVGGDIRVDNGKYEGWGILTLHPDVDQTGDDHIAFLNNSGSEVARFHTNGFMGIGTSTPDDALDVVGNIDLTGCLTWGETNIIGGNCPSDQRLKKNIQDLKSQLPLLKKLRPVRYQWTNRNSHNRQSEIGLLAQEVEQVIDEMVTIGEDGYKRVQYDISLPIRMIKALQERQAEIEDQQILIEQLKAQIQKMDNFLTQPKKD